MRAEKFRLTLLLTLLALSSSTVLRPNQVELTVTEHRI